MNIDWTALGQVSAASLLVTVGMVGVFTLGIVGTSRTPASRPGPEATSPTASVRAGTGGSRSALLRTGGYVCFALCAAVVVYGIQLIVA